MRWKGFTLSDFQVRAVQAVRAGSNVLVGAPTGAGKTLVAEYAIEDAVQRGKRCIYTAPIKALSNQKYRDFRDEPEIDVGLMTGDVTIHPGAQVLIMTTEILRNAIFESPETLSDVEYVVFDEVHFLDDPERGCVWEEALIFAPPSIRFICLSATIDNIEEIGEWIGEIREHPLVVIESAVRPVPLHHALYSPRAGTFELSELEAVRKRESKRVERENRSGGRGRGGGRGSRGSRGGARGRRGRGGDRREPPPWMPPPAGPLLDELQDRGLLPALVFSFSRKDCERLARRNARRRLLSNEEEARMRTIQRGLIELFKLDPAEMDGEILSMARRGLGYHHAGMLPVNKELVERMFTSGMLRLLFTTETFALGINMPARTVVFNALRKYDGVSIEYLRTRDYLQMAGRAGRQGIDTEGLVWSLLSERDLLEAPMKRILSGRPEPVKSHFRLSYSTLLHLVADIGRERLPEAWEKSLECFQHRDKRPKAQDRNRKRRRRTIESRLAFLDELRFLEDGDQLTPRGRTAQLISGYEIQITELLYAGALEDLSAPALAMIFVAQIHEERRRGDERWLPRKVFGEERQRVDRILHRLAGMEAALGIDDPLKLCDWGLTPAVLAWCEGASMEDLEELTDSGPGDVCRAFRMAIQLLRQVRHAIDPSWDLREKVQEAMALLNRDEIDARRQLELG
jgi:superfamily II RNA helicase